MIRPIAFAVVRLVLGGGLLLSGGGCQQLKHALSRRNFVWASHIGRAEVRQKRDIVPGAGHVLCYVRLKIDARRGSHTRQYTQVYLRVRRLADLPLRQPVALPDSAVAISGFIARDWPHDMSDFTGTITRLSTDTLSPVLRLRVAYTVREKQRTLRERLVFQADTAYFRPKK